ncbi:hypothetical protein JRI60_18560 [Archangium violaceum]|uniref:hypothetical protein n=1 Tax=Archangium violaceum TaxID=83451 RepID=UPI001951CB8C|nr:hypothetical protein [Archangium violaceum]QRO00885.1 hypothetical protein JRI60_18560 [Archangium violaceum]
MDRIVVPELPLAYADLASAGEELTSRLVPQVLTGLGDLLGIKPPPISKKKRSAIRRRVQQYLLASRGYLLGSQLVDEELSPPLARYAFREGEIRQSLMLGASAEHGEYDACVILLRRLQEQAARPDGSSLPGYAEARDAVDALASEVATVLETRDIRPNLNGWYQLKSANKVMHFSQRIGPVVRHWRRQEPKRLTQGLVVQLLHEYRDSAAIFELLIGRLIGVWLIANGQAVEWHDLDKQGLASHLNRASSGRVGPHLQVLGRGIERGVRNALAHGHPIMNRRNGKVEFHDRGGLAAEWSAAEFYRNTRRLSAFVFAMLAFDSQFQLVHYRRSIEFLASQAIAAGAKPREIELKTRSGRARRTTPASRGRSSRITKRRISRSR